MKKLDRDIDTLLTKEKNDLAVAAQADLNNKQQLAQEYHEQWQQHEVEYRQLLDARLKLEARLVMIRQQREQLKSLMELTEAKKTHVQDHSPVLMIWPEWVMRIFAALAKVSRNALTKLTLNLRW